MNLTSMILSDGSSPKRVHIADSIYMTSKHWQKQLMGPEVRMQFLQEEGVSSTEGRTRGFGNAGNTPFRLGAGCVHFVIILQMYTYDSCIFIYAYYTSTQKFVLKNRHPKSSKLPISLETKKAGEQF